MSVPAGWSVLPKGEILAELERVLESHHFRSSKKCSRFLRHIVGAAVEGRVDCLKERTLGVDVFDREPHYDTNQDPIVRGTAGEVRKRLAQYYLEADGRGLRFSLPLGSYVPEAHYVAPDRPKLAPPVVVHSPAPAPRVPPLGRFAAGAVVLALAAFFISLWFVMRPGALDRFWGPLLTTKSVLVCMGQPQFYTFQPNTARALGAWFLEGYNADRAASPQASVPYSEIVPMWDRSVALADAQAFSRLVNLFAQKRKEVDLRGERLVSLADLRGRPSIFIGAFDNDWAMSLASDLRFYFDTDHQHQAQVIRDRQKPGETDWKLVNAWPPKRDITEDYALVTRVVNRTTERNIVLLGGITQYGTEAAAEFVTDPNYFSRALTGAPPDWSRKNIQIVLSTRVLSGVSGPPTVVATYFW
ncbi:MAG: hypothetical protein JO340_18315 [Acidobacteriaceae bacterium]|nr:hypothetical protein [Acidobacteriaceae bacterium]